MPRAEFFTTTFAPAITAPLSSVTVPLMLAVVCAKAALLKLLSTKKSKQRRRRIFRVIDDPLKATTMALFLPSKKRVQKTTVNIPSPDFAVLVLKNAPRKRHAPMELLICYGGFAIPGPDQEGIIPPRKSTISMAYESAGIPKNPGSRFGYQKRKPLIESRRCFTNCLE